MLQVQVPNKDNGNVVRPNGKKPEVENPRWRPLYWKYFQYNGRHLGFYTTAPHNDEMNTNNGVKWRRFIVPKKFEKANDKLRYTF